MRCVYVVANYALRPPKTRAYRRMETVKLVSAADTRTYFFFFKRLIRRAIGTHSTRTRICMQHHLVCSCKTSPSIAQISKYLTVSSTCILFVINLFRFSCSYPLKAFCSTQFPMQCKSPSRPASPVPWAPNRSKTVVVSNPASFSIPSSPPPQSTGT